MDKLREEIALAVRSGAKDILLTGETGTGKEVVARAIATMAVIPRIDHIVNVRTAYTSLDGEFSA
jgi:DNA-binding NtrC family response regulator